MPLFSVVIPTYNRPDQLSRAVLSVIRQSLIDFELIIVDDGSTHCYAQCVAKQICDSRVRVIRRYSNQGVASARNIGIAAASGSYVSFLDDDDEYSENFLEITSSWLSGTGHTIAASWSGTTYFEDNQKLSYATVLSADDPGVDDELLQDFLSAGVGCGVTIKSECLASIGGFNESFKIGEDTELFVRMLSMGYRPIQLPPDLVKVYHDSQPRLTSTMSYADRANVYEWIRAAYAEFLSQHPRLRQNLSPNRISGMWLDWDMEHRNAR
jgi:glycosyltransferase involved in cell wall biosynthesis